MDPALVVAAAVVGVFLVWGVLRSRMRCPKCGMRLPMMRTPADSQEAAWGGWTCRNCGTKLDRSGKPRS
jgi:hypothetical protein